MEVGDSGVDLLPRKMLFILCSVDSILLLCGDPEVMQNAINQLAISDRMPCALHLMSEFCT